MHPLYVFHILWRILLYIVYGIAALMVYRAVFQLPSLYAGLIALGIVLAALIKDLYDELTESGYLSKVAYKLVEHNPFNIVLLWGVLTGLFVIETPLLYWAIVAVATADILLDGYRDFHSTPVPRTYAGLYVLLAIVIFALHELWGLDVVMQVLWDSLTALPII